MKQIFFRHRNQLLACLSVCMLAAFPCIAQQKYNYVNQNFAGYMRGGSGDGLQLQTIHGLKYKKLSAGAGLGFDTYRANSLQTFINGTWYLLPKEQLRLVANGGLNWPLSIKDIKPINAINPSAKQGYYWEGGVNYNLKWKGFSKGLLFGLGYAEKKIPIQSNIIVECLVPPCPDYHETINYQLKTWVFKVGMSF